MGRYTDMLAGLQQASTAAVAGAIARQVNVQQRVTAATYEGPFPRILHGPLDLNAVVINSGQLGQDSGHPALFSALIFDQTSKTLGIEQSQQDVLALIDALTTYYGAKANMRLPNNSCKGVIGIRFRFDPFGMYRRTDAGTDPVAVGVIALIGLPVGE